MNWEYIAGFFDAEGTLWIKGHYTHFQIVNTNRKVLETIKNFIGFGNLYIRTFRGNHWGEKKIYVYQVCKKTDVIFIAKNIVKYCLIKREKLLELFKFLDVEFQSVQPKISYPYLAGLIDGDGSIIKTGQGYWTISISSKDKELLEKIKDFIIQNTPNYVGIRKKVEVYQDGNIYTLRVGDQKVISFLVKKLSPYLIIKKERAESVLKTIKIRKNYKLINYTLEELKSLLESYYVTQKLSIRQITKKLNMSYNAVYHWLTKFGIERRRCGAPEIAIPKEKLVELYVNKKMSAIQIAKQLEIAHTTVLKELRKYGIEVRNKKLKDVPNLEETLRKLYLEQNLSLSQIAKEFGVTKQAIFRWVKKFNLKKEVPTIEIENSRKLRQIPKEGLKQIFTDLYLNKELR